MVLFSVENKEEIKKREEWGIFIHKFMHYGKCLFDYNSIAIGIGIRRYTTLYEFIRGINHEYLHKILMSECGKEVSGKLDYGLVHNTYKNSVFKEELYELQTKTWKDISMVSFLLKERILHDYFKIRKLMGERNLSKSVEKRLTNYMKKKLEEASVVVLSPDTDSEGI